MLAVQIVQVLRMSTYRINVASASTGATDTTSLSCRYGNPQMWHHCGTCCGLRPHFNWVVATCEAGLNNIQQSDESVMKSDELLKQHMLGCWVWLGHESSNISRGDPGHWPVLLEHATVRHRRIPQDQLRRCLPV